MTRYRLQNSCCQARPGVLLVLISLLALLLAPIGCASAATGQNSETTTELVFSTPRPTVTSQQTTAPVGTGGMLRLWWPYRSTLNPLLESTLAGRAVYDLVYRSLFRITADERIETDLAANLLWLDGGHRLMIAIKAELTFHDGTPVTAEDAAAALLFLTAPDNLSPWRYGLEAIVDVRVLDDQVLEIELSNPDPWLVWALTFPVIPADRITTIGLDVIPGTGNYEIDSYDPDSGLLLERTEETNNQVQVQQILVREYRNQQAAMQAYEQDEIDLVLLDTQLLSRYAVRSSLRIAYFGGSELLFLSYNTRNRRVLQDEAVLRRIKQVVQDLRTDNRVFNGWAEPSPLGLTAVSWLNQGSAVSPADILAEATAEWPEAAQDLILIAPVQDRRRVQLAADLALALEQADIPCEIRLLEAERFQEDLEAGRYDLALLSAYLPDKPEPGFIIQNPAPAAFVTLEQIRPESGGLADAADWLEQWQQQMADVRWTMRQADVLPDDWLNALTQALVRSPWDSLCLPHMGLVYGDRISGQSRPSRYHPYENIEELWVWSGQ